MALSNLKLEPRREITESVVGVVVFVGCLWGDYYLATMWKAAGVGGGSGDLPVGLLMLVVILAVAAGGFIVAAGLFAIHAIGEAACARMGKLGIDPRPRIRYEYKNVWNAELLKYERVIVVREE